MQNVKSHYLLNKIGNKNLEGFLVETKRQWNFYCRKSHEIKPIHLMIKIMGTWNINTLGDMRPFA